MSVKTMTERDNLGIDIRIMVTIIICLNHMRYGIA